MERLGFNEPGVKAPHLVEPGDRVETVCEDGVVLAIAVDRHELDNLAEYEVHAIEPLEETIEYAPAVAVYHKDHDQIAVWGYTKDGGGAWVPTEE